jgi:holo-[acyl-carrier protein] synthase
MIAGVGIDIIEVERVSGNIMKENGFRELVFSANEIAYCEAKTNKFEHYAARFAAKEAFFKAIGTGWLKDTAFNEVEIINDEYGKPGISFLGETRVVIDALLFVNIQVSLTHVKEVSAAVVVVER